MTRKELDEKLSLINEKVGVLNKELASLNKTRREIQAEYVKEYPHLIIVGSKIRIKESIQNSCVDNPRINEVIAFVADNKIIESFNWDYSHIYEDEDIGTKLLKVKKDGLPSERVERIRGKVVEIEILN